MSAGDRGGHDGVGRRRAGDRDDPLDAGHVRDGVGPSYGLSGSGIALGWQGPAGLNLKATLARRHGNNPNPAANGKDQDGSLDMNRLWLTASLPF